MEEQIVFGDEMMPITLPDDVQIAPPGLSTTLSAVSSKPWEDPAAPLF